MRCRARRPWQLAGWKWLFILEAIPSLILGVVILLVLDDGIAKAKWLTSDEKGMLKQEIDFEADRVESRSTRQAFLSISKHSIRG